MTGDSSITEKLNAETALPVIVSPLFLNSTPKLVIASVKEGLIGSIPAKGQQTSEGFDAWLTEIDEGIAALKRDNPGATIAPYAANLIFKQDDPRVGDDLAAVIKRRVPIILASGQPTEEQIALIHSYGGIVLHDVASTEEARKALANGADGLIAITNGAGGQGSTMNPIAFIDEIRQFFSGPLVLAGCISNGHDIFAAQAMGADFVSMGTRFIATEEAQADPRYKQMVVDSTSADIIYTSAFTKQPANFMRQSITDAGYDADKVKREGVTAERVVPPSGEKSKSWKYVWAAGQGSGNVHDILPVAKLADRLKKEYAAAKEGIAKKFGLSAAHKETALPKRKAAGPKLH